MDKKVVKEEKPKKEEKIKQEKKVIKEEKKSKLKTKKINKANKINEEKVKKEIKQEIKQEVADLNEPKEPAKTKKVRRIKKHKKMTKAFEENEKVYKARKIRYGIEIGVFVIFSIIMLVLLCNRTFFKEEYETSKIRINIPLLMFFEKDTGTQVTLKTLRKTKYVEDFFETQLNKLRVLKCDSTGKILYYDENTGTAIYDIKVEKDGIVKTVTIDYVQGNQHCLCVSTVTGEQAEKLCNR